MVISQPPTEEAVREPATVDVSVDRGDDVTVDGVVYVKIAGNEEEAFCFVCRRAGPMNGMYNNQEGELYCHPDCLKQYAAQRKKE